MKIRITTCYIISAITLGLSLANGATVLDNSTYKGDDNRSVGHGGGINKCIGPNNRQIYTGDDCPEGYELDSGDWMAKTNVTHGSNSSFYEESRRAQQERAKKALEELAEQEYQIADELTELVDEYDEPEMTREETAEEKSDETSIDNASSDDDEQVIDEQILNGDAVRKSPTEQPQEHKAKSDSPSVQDTNNSVKNGEGSQDSEDLPDANF